MMADASAGMGQEENLKKYWLSFKTWFGEVLPGAGILRPELEGFSSSDGGTYWLAIDFDKEYRLQYGTDYPGVLEQQTPSVGEIKQFIELAYKVWVEPKKRYDFTVEVNNRLRQFSVPLRLESGRLSTNVLGDSMYVDQILDYEMFEKKILCSEKQIASKDYSDKKSALDGIIAALQYFLSLQDGDRPAQQHRSAAQSVSEDKNSKMCVVVKEEIQQIKKISNEFFDIRHNEHLNKSKEVRESLQDFTFMEYLYRRVHALLNLLRAKADFKKLRRSTFSGGESQEATIRDE